MKLRDFAASLDVAERFETLWPMLVQFVHAREVRHVAYHHLPPLGAPDARVLRVSNAGFPRDFLEIYLAGRARGTTPVTSQAHRSGEPVYFDEIEGLREMSPAERAHVDALREGGLGAGVGIPVFGPHGRNGMFALGLRPEMPRLSREGLSEVNWACQATHLRYCALLLPALGEMPALSTREAEVLSWVAQGKSNAAIGSILGISAHTVDAHLRRIYRKLGVFDRISAALRGLGFGLIYTEGGATCPATA